jgi:hypothetical protein
MGSPHKINSEIAAAIRASTETLKVLAERYGVSMAAVCQCRKGKTYASYKRKPYRRPHLSEMTEEQIFGVAKKAAAVAPERIPEIVMRVGSSVFDLGMHA